MAKKPAKKVPAEQEKQLGENRVFPRRKSRVVRIRTEMMPSAAKPKEREVADNE